MPNHLETKNAQITKAIVSAGYIKLIVLGGIFNTASQQNIKKGIVHFVKVIYSVQKTFSLQKMNFMNILHIILSRKRTPYNPPHISP